MSRADRLTQGIYWDRSLNDQTGCSKDGRSGCAHCWAERFSVRLEAMGQPQYAGATQDGKWSGDIRLWPQAQDQVKGWKKPRVIFWNDMSDPFHKDVPFSHIDRKMAIISLTPQHTHLMLTKRPRRMQEYFSNENARRGRIAGWVKTNLSQCMYDPKNVFLSSSMWPIPNLVGGVSVWDQESADRMIPILLETNLATRIVSLEPCLGAVDFEDIDGNDVLSAHSDSFWDGIDALRPTTLDGIILGGESGPGARPMHPDWARSVRDQCQAAGVLFFFKQWGEWGSFEVGKMIAPTRAATESALYCTSDGQFHRSNFEVHAFEGIYRVGKKAAGRLLDGRTWDELPGVLG